MHKYNYLFLGLSVVISLTPSISQAQLIPDNTLGKENSTVNKVNAVDSLKRIDGGAIRGSNLFHSFKEFNIDSGKSVYFSNPSTVENILTRITGNNPSSIFGKLGVLGNANLFLINPNGIIFGKDASLDINGSFTGTTSTGVLFDNNFEFSATSPQTVPLLKINITPGLQYPRFQQGDINSKANLTVGKDLNLIGKNLNLSGQLKTGRDLTLKAENNLQIRDFYTNPFIADAKNNLVLQSTEIVDIFALNHPDSGFFSGNDLILKSPNPVLGDARYFSGRNFRIEQLDGGLGNLESPNDPIIRANGDVSFDSYNGASLHILAGGSVNITGDITITGADRENGLEEQVTLSNGENLEIDGKNQATLDIRAGINTINNVTEIITANGDFTPDVPNTQVIKSSSDIVLGGKIQVNQANGLVYLTNQYNPNPNLSGGKIQIQENINTSSNLGNAGNIIIDASGNLEISGQIKADSLIAAGGNISLISGDTISMIGADIDSQSNIADINTEINGGDIKLIAPSIILEDASRVTVSIVGLGTSGNLFVETDDIKIFDGSGLSSITGGIGNAGDIDITTQRLLVQNSLVEQDSISIENINTFRTGISTFVSILPEDASFNQDFFKSGNGGNININASESIELTANKSETFSPTLREESLASIRLDTGIISGTTGSGVSGKINISTGKLIVKNGAGISTSSIPPSSLTIIYPDLVSSLIDDRIPDSQADAIIQQITTQLNQFDGAGQSGELNINANNIELIGKAGLTTATFSSGNAGDLIINNTDNFQLKNGAIVTTSTFSSGNAGDLQVNTNKLNINNGSLMAAGTLKEGDGGTVSITALESVEIIGTSNDTDDKQVSSRIIATAETDATGNAGNLELDTKKLVIADGAQISASTESTISGDITINARDLITVSNNSKISSEATGDGDAGILNITTDELKISNTSQANVNSKGNGNAGNIEINARNVILDNTAEIAAKTTESGTEANIVLNNLDSLELLNQSIISASTVNAEAGNIDINARDFVKVSDNSKIASEAIGDGDAGNLTITTNELNISDNSQANVSSKGNGNAGSITVNASNVILNNQAEIASTTTESGTDGNITFNNLNSLKLLNSKINASTVNGEAGDIDINATDVVKVSDDSKISSEATGDGQAGELRVITNLFQINNNSQANVSSKGNGNAGDININARDFVSISDNSKIASEATGDGNAGELRVITNLFQINNNSQANVSSKGNGVAGSITVNASNIILNNQAEIAAKTTESGTDGNITFYNLNSLELSNSQINASTINGEAGDININSTDIVKVSDNSKIASEATGDGQAGELRVITNLFQINNNSQANVSSKGNGDAGSVNINARDVMLINGAEISATTELGDGGDVEINATNSIELAGEGGFSVQSNQGGTAGSITVNTNQFNIRDNAKVNVSSRLGQAGNLEITANNLFLNQGILTAETGITKNLEGANITLDIKDLLMISNTSLISAEAFNNANGGNITINNSKGFVIGLPFENSDIIANANQGNGGNIEITTQNIFGLKFRENRTEKSDISASSKFGLNGEVTVEQLNLNPVYELINLPSNLAANTQINAGCSASRGSNFTISGRGGLPQNPNNLFDGNTNLVELVNTTLTQKITAKIYSTSSQNTNYFRFDNSKNKIVEATGWIQDIYGNIVFIAQSSDLSSDYFDISSVSCHNFLM